MQTPDARLGGVDRQVRADVGLEEGCLLFGAVPDLDDRLSAVGTGAGEVGNEAVTGGQPRTEVGDHLVVFGSGHGAVLVITMAIAGLQ